MGQPFQISPNLSILVKSNHLLLATPVQNAQPSITGQISLLRSLVEKGVLRSAIEPLLDLLPFHVQECHSLQSSNCQVSPLRQKYAERAALHPVGEPLSRSDISVSTAAKHFRPPPADPLHSRSTRSNDLRFALQQALHRVVQRAAQDTFLAQHNLSYSSPVSIPFEAHYRAPLALRCTLLQTFVYHLLRVGEVLKTVEKLHQILIRLRLSLHWIMTLNVLETFL